MCSCCDAFMWCGNQQLLRFDFPFSNQFYIYWMLASRIKARTTVWQIDQACSLTWLASLAGVNQNKPFIIHVSFPCIKMLQFLLKGETTAIKFALKALGKSSRVLRNYFYSKRAFHYQLSPGEKYFSPSPPSYLICIFCMNKPSDKTADKIFTRSMYRFIIWIVQWMQINLI